jgi:hypothetical protein
MWHDIVPDMLDRFYDWHTNEHMPERAGIPGFRRGRRYTAASQATRPQIFTIYETDTFEVTVGRDYMDRLNAPTPWSKEMMTAFREMMRAVTRVRFSDGPGSGTFAATIRFGTGTLATDPSGRLTMISSLHDILKMPQIAGLHVMASDRSGSQLQTTETKARGDVPSAPDGILMIEAGNLAPAEAAGARAVELLIAAGATSPVPGVYRLENTRLKTARAAG